MSGEGPGQGDARRIRVHHLLLDYDLTLSKDTVPLRYRREFSVYKEWLFQTLETPELAVGSFALLLKCSTCDEFAHNLHLIASGFSCSEVTLATLRRSGSELRHLLSLGHNANGNKEELMAPLLVALDWTEGVKILLNAGADTFDAIYLVLCSENVDMAALLLEHGCALFNYPAQPRDYSWFTSVPLLSIALSLRKPKQFTRLIIQAMAGSRRRLMDLAWERLSKEQLSFLPVQTLTGETLLDEGAESVANALEAAGVPIRPPLWPGSYASVYHLPWLTAQAASWLYDSGFRCVDVKDNLGMTPLLLHCSRLIASFNTAAWFLDKGAAHDCFSVTLPTNILHAVAAATTLTDMDDQNPIDQLSPESLQRDRHRFGRIYSICGPTSTDACICFCSSFGCTPMTVHLRCQRRDFNIHYTWRALSIWQGCGNVSPSLAEACQAEACRLIIFERLGMAHTCCKYEVRRRSDYDIMEKCEMALEEQQELREEDASLVVVLDAYMRLYHELRMAHSGPVSLFWDAWWQAVDRFLPESWKSDSDNYSDTGEADSVMSENQSEDGTDEARNLELAYHSEGVPEIDSSYGLDGQIKEIVRSLLKYKDGEDSAEIFADSMECLFHG